MMQIARYLFVQVLAYGIDMAGFILLFSYFHIEPLLANAASKILAGVVAFIAHRRFTFRVVEAGSKVQHGLRYFGFLVLNIPLSALLLSAVLWLTSMTVVAKFLADVIYFVITYWVSQRFVFIGRGPVKSSIDIGRFEK